MNVRIVGSFQNLILESLVNQINKFNLTYNYVLFEYFSFG